MRRINFLAIALVVVWTLSAGAAVKTEEKSNVKFEGLLGRMVGMFGGKAAKEGVTETVAVKGNRKMTRNSDTGQIIDLDEEKVYDVEFKGKSFRVTTFEELRQQIREAQEKMQQEMAKMKDAAPAPAPQQQGVEMEFDYDLKESGQRKTINGFDCRELVMTIGLHEKGKKLEESGGMLLTSNLWLAPQIAAMKEIMEFDLRFFQKLALAFDLRQLQQMSAAIAANPLLKDAMAKFQQENAKLDGTTILSVTTFQGIQSKEQMAQQAQAQKEEESPTNVPITTSKGGLLGGLAGGLAGRMARRAAEPKEETPQTPGRSTIMTSTAELLKVSPSVTDADVAIPAGFKEKK